jgi:hypothetical protein
VFVKRSNPNYAQPWQTQVQRSAVGSAFVVDVEKRHILTNAHVVAHNITIHVRRPGHAKKWKASLLCEGKSCDLALLTVGAETTCMQVFTTFKALLHTSASSMIADCDVDNMLVAMSMSKPYSNVNAQA